MRLEDIGFYSLSDERAKTASHTSRMRRCEIILTDNCNFKCPYCRGIRGDCSGTMSIDKVKHIIDLWCADHLQNIRFSGGEPTLYSAIEEVVAHARSNGVERIAISTNGSAPTDKYRRLVACGVNDFSISLDACCASGAERMSGLKEVNFNRIQENIKELSKICYVTVGVVLTEENKQEVKGIVSLAESLGVADVRIIPAAQYSRNMEWVSDIPTTNSTRILQYRLNNIRRNRGVRGMEPTDFKRCPLVLDDSAIAGNYHFPCVIYLREGGNPIGIVNDKMREDRLNWFKKTNVYDNTICRNNCLDVCVDYNNKWMNYHLKGLYRLSPETFDWSLWRSGSAMITQMHLPCRFESITSDYGKEQLRKHAIGWTPGELLSCRPKEDCVGVMYFMDGEQGWFHMRKNEFYEVFSHDSSTQV